MAKVLLISPPFQKEYMRNARCDFVSLSKSSWYPIWLGMAGSYLESRGHKTILLDAQVMGMNESESIKVITDFKPDVIALYTGRLSEESDIAFGDSLASNGYLVIYIGPYASIDPEKTLKMSKNVKFLIKKEFDLPLEEIASGIDPKKVKNVFYRDGHDIVKNELRPLYNTEILDTFPVTSKYFNEQLDITKYKTPSELHPYMDVMSGRGCAWGRCNFCLWVQSFVTGSVYNLRSIDHFMEEFEYMRDYMPNIRSVMIQDDMLTNKRAMDISQGILDRNIKINWSCYAKPNSHLSEETLKLMKRSGCLNLHVGFESGDEGILKTIDKGSTVEQAIEFADLAHKSGLNIHGDFAMGHYGDTKETMLKTLALAKRINPHTAQFQIMIPFEKTKFWDQLDSTKSFNTAGEPSYEDIGGADAEEIREMAKYAYRKFYFSPGYLKKIVTNPGEYFFNRFDQYIRAIPAVTWKKWIK